MTATLTESPALPERIAGLATLARNLSWSWNHEARALYRSIDPTLWRLTRHNPFALLRRGGARPPRVGGPRARVVPPVARPEVRRLPARVVGTPMGRAATARALRPS